MSDKISKPPDTCDNYLTESLKYIGVRKRVKLIGQCLKQDKVTFAHKEVVSIYIFYETNLWAYAQGVDSTLRSSLFGAVNITKNANFDK